MVAGSAGLFFHFFIFMVFLCAFFEGGVVRERAREMSFLVISGPNAKSCKLVEGGMVSEREVY